MDVIFSRGMEVSGWSVLDELNLSNLAYVAFSIDPHPGWPHVDAPLGVHSGWALKNGLGHFGTDVLAPPVWRCYFVTYQY